ncbi:MAG: hypothetical protein LGB07_03455 [Sulfurovum sp.]|nr:hypothetical protein [Sulfurovum sp.]MCB4744694.1 hypothetical protein [Sulfurovum sp.]MCB4746837.1 hypothetical protein [Sulfurovum sp.]MCB4748520.1 hypothetical protein [Sulfurovum sp.]MCB4750180.1 hypothetical protein [Sulfurovum sp.]
MSFGDYVYIVVALLFSYMTLTIVRNNFLSKFDKEGNRKDLEENRVNKES